MEKKLIKLAVAALATVAVLPAGVEAGVQQSAGTFLAAGCGGNGCNGNKTAYNYGTSNTPSQTDTYNYNAQGRPVDANIDYRVDTDANVNTNANRSSWWSSSTTTISETELLKQLSPQGRAIYQSLDTEGKKEAQRLAAQENFKDKDSAVREAQRRTSENRTGGFTTGSSYNQSYNQNSGMNRTR